MHTVTHTFLFFLGKFASALKVLLFIFYLLFTLLQLHQSFTQLLCRDPKDAILLTFRMINALEIKFFIYPQLNRSKSPLAASAQFVKSSTPQRLGQANDPEVLLSSLPLLRNCFTALLTPVYPTLVCKMFLVYFI